MEKIRILLVEDDHNLGQVLKDYLELKGYEPILCVDGEAGWKTYQHQYFHLCILDVMMPKLDGYSLAEKIRKKDENIPIIFLTAKSLREDAIQAFKVGADDYMTKPFSMEELLLRIKAILKRSLKEEEKVDILEFQIGKFRFEFDSQKLYDPDGSIQKLTSKEAGLLKMLCINKNQVLDRSEALKKIWLDDNYFNSRSMDVYITKLRKFLKNDESIQIINVHGQGFKLVELKN